MAEAMKFAETVIAKAITQSNPAALGQVAGLIRNGPGSASK